MVHSRGEASVGATFPWRSGTIYVVLTSSLIGVMGVSLISPVLPELRPVYGVTDAQIGLVVTAYTIPGVFVTPFLGLAADRIGRKRVLVPLLVTFGGAGAGISFVTDFSVVLALRFLQGIGASALISLSITLLGDTYDGRQLDSLVGINSSATAVGASFFPLVGGMLASLRWNAPFLFFGTGVLVAIFAVFVLDESTSTDSIDVWTYASRMYGVARRPRALVVLASLSLAFFMHYGAIITVLPLYLSDEFGLTTGQIGQILVMVTLSNAVVASLYGRFAAWRDPPALLALGFVAFGTSLVVVWLAPSIAVVGVAMLVFGVGFGVVLPSVDTVLIDLISEDLRAGVMSVRTSMLRLGQTLGPVGFTVSARRLFESPVQGYRALILLTGVVVTVAAVVAYVQLRR